MCSGLGEELEPGEAIRVTGRRFLALLGAFFFTFLVKAVGLLFCLVGVLCDRGLLKQARGEAEPVGVGRAMVPPETLQAAIARRTAAIQQILPGFAWRNFVSAWSSLSRSAFGYRKARFDVRIDPLLVLERNPESAR